MKNEPKQEYKTLTSRAQEHSCSDFDQPLGYRVHSSGWPIPYRLTESAPHYEDLDQRAREAGL